MPAEPLTDLPLFAEPPRRRREEWTADERRVFRELFWNHQGRDRAIKAPDLAEIVGLAERNLQRIVHRLIRERYKPIGSAMSPPPGYFLATTPEEIREVSDLLFRKGVGMLVTAQRLGGIPAKEAVEALQTEMEVA